MRKAGKFKNVWEALADTPAQAANLRTRTELMFKIAACERERVEAGRGSTALWRHATTHERATARPCVALLA
jgi:hypothetical protein